MSTPKPEDTGRSGPHYSWAETESLNTIYAFFEGVGDSTIRPMRPEIPRDYPRLRPPEQKPEDPPPSDQSPPPEKK
jgi:hypothetical protein